MWSRLDDSLMDHRKIFKAGELLGENGAAIALGFFTVGLMWTNRHLTDGHLPRTVVQKFQHVEHPLLVAHALVSAGLLEKTRSGFLIHDYVDFNPPAITNRARERRAKTRARLKNGHS